MSEKAEQELDAQIGKRFLVVEINSDGTLEASAVGSNLSDNER